MTQRDEVWAQGSQPGDAPISSVVLTTPPEVVERAEAAARVRTFARGARPPGPGNTPLRLLWDLAKIMGLDVD